MSSEEEDLRPISEVYEACLLSFRKLCTALENDSSSPNLQSVQINDDLGRFRVWAANIGAHRHGKSSLDYRLQEASYLKVKTTEFLRELNNALRRGTSVIHSGEHGEELISSCDPDLDAFSESSGSSLGSSFIEEMASESRSPLDSTLFKIKTIITCLYRLSITIRNPALRDRSQKYARIDLSHYEQWDIRRVADKFINAEDFLTTRLGKANTKRRQYLYYEKIHHENIAEMNDDGLSSFAKSQTTATAFIPTPNTTFDEGTMAEEAMSQTTLATTMTTSVGSEEILKVPDPPNLILDEPFECPYCFKIVEVQSTIAWRQHVFLDLQPYVCTFPTCGDAVKLYGSSREWYEHEVSKHRRQWFCKTHGGFTNKEEFTTHLNNHHPDQALALELTLERCERPRVTNTPDKCPLCGKEYSGKKLRSHLAKHMQQIALFVLPKTDAENDEETSKSAVIDRFVEYQLAS
ncbi:hypothetical protein EDC01DRAFT_624436 [Geopyxis carbonaria]|nr:hypothetical protein EDC01DRAFT_624436 [Geopyxis carbonaria]